MTTYDVYRALPDGYAALVNTACDLTEARLILTNLVLESPGEYFIYCEQSRNVIEYFKWSESRRQLEITAGTVCQSSFVH